MINPGVIGVMKKRYLREGEVCEQDMFKRVAEAVGKGDVQKTLFFNMMNNGIFMPNTPTLANLGTNNQMASACFVLPIPDSMTGIFTTLHNAAMVHKDGGGTGFCFSDLRPEKCIVKSTGRTSSGPMPFLEAYNSATNTVKQGGMRRGANMGTFHVWHPDIRKFITCKNRDGDISNFNLSVMITDEFMEAVNNDGDFDLKWKDEVYETVKAREIFNMIVHQAWKNGEPGIIFIDAVNRQKVPEGFEQNEINATNPCGEQPLEPYGSCNLGAINLGLMVNEDCTDIDYKVLGEAVKNAVEFLNLVIDINDFPLPEIREKALKDRNIGLGIMGVADLMIKLKISYGSQKCLEILDEILKFMYKTADATSKALGNGKRINKTLITIAPTGTTSMFCNASSGLEPYFNFWYSRNIDDKRVLIIEGILNDVITEAQRVYIQECFDKEEEVDIDKVGLPSYFVRSQDVAPENHVRVQAICQKHVDSAISKTVNMANSATEPEVEAMIVLAHQLECKGMTIYRDGSRSEQILSDIGSKSKDDPNYIVKGEITLPNEMPAKTFRIQAALGDDEKSQNFYIHIGLIKNRPVQLFIDYKRQSDYSDESAKIKAQMIELLGMSVSYQMRYRVPLTVIIKQLTRLPFSWMLSLHTKIANILEQFLETCEDICPECLSKIVYTEGCRKCACGAQNKCDQ